MTLGEKPVIDYQLFLQTVGSLFRNNPYILTNLSSGTCIKYTRPIVDPPEAKIGLYLSKYKARIVYCHDLFHSSDNLRGSRVRSEDN